MQEESRRKEGEDPPEAEENSLLLPHDEACLLEAIKESELASREDNCMPFGCVVADSKGNVVARARNGCRRAEQRGGSRGGGVDVTRHAEMEAIRALCALPGDKASGMGGFEDYTLYSSTMPCVMCAGAIYWSGVPRLVYGCSAAQLEEVSGPGGFDVDVRLLYGMASPGARRIRVVGPLCAEQALKVHRDSGVWNFGKEPTSPAESSAKTATTTQADEDIELERSLRRTGWLSGDVVAGSGGSEDENTVPVVDLSSGSDDEIRSRLWDAATRIGFFTVVGHGIDPGLVDSAFRVSREYFGQGTAAKAEQSPLDMSINCGFEHFAQVRPSTGVADQKESLQATAREGCMDGRWPNPEFRDATLKLADEAHRVAGRILSLLEPLATPHVAPGTLAGSHTLWSPEGQCTLRYLHYPAMDPEDARRLRVDGYFRAGPHTDWTNVTLLFQEAGGRGLECCANPRKTASSAAAAWTAVDPVPGGIAVNIGDMLARWSDNRLYSNLHRVRLPDDASRARYSIAFFAQSDKGVLIESSANDPITAGDYILSRIRSNFAKDAE